MTVWFVSRHPGALAWAQTQPWHYDQHCMHLDPQQIAAGDVVIGNLPVAIAAEVCQRGAQFVNLSLKLPAHLRGKELSLAEMQLCEAQLEAYDIRKQAQRWPVSTYINATLALMAQLPVVEIKVKARNLGLRAPQNMGSAWHGALGKVLHDYHPTVYAALYDGDATASPRPYVLRPPHYDDTLAADTAFTFSVLLLGEGVQHATALTDALQRLSTLGVGPGRGRFSIEAISCEPITLPRPEHSVTASTLSVLFHTPTLLKQGNQHLKEMPSMLLLIKRILGRVQGLLPASTIPEDLKQHLLQQASNVSCSLAESALSWHSTPRYSARQKAWMPFGGLCGSLLYRQVPPELELWLKWAQWLHIGNKTTFGHGEIRVLSESEHNL